ncbi:DNA-binding response regulator [Cereibacter sphaeroides]|uniref:response regulator transcription factor n=1 Tax=Cereibacter sphaeroides TaxID=1063 RepID=UPI000F52AC4A|nr:response regulator transcription factor [Cereibacter sphaeroides]AZB63067.1 DNA-binding response regulator [Cereibacter sphaeroides]AZB68964.1 DNA-binding response regulator [Cereibacter sphaeroides]
MDQDLSRPPLSVLVADDQPLVRELILGLLAREPDLAPEGVVDLPEALARIAAHGPFDVVLLDLVMPGMNGLEGLARAMAANGGRPVLLMSGNLPEEMLAEAQRLGVAGVLPKTRFAAIADTVREAGRRDRPALPETERQLLQMLVAGEATEELAARFGREAFETALAALFARLEVSTRTQAVLAARRRGLV